MERFKLNQIRGGLRAFGSRLYLNLGVQADAIL